MRGEANSLDQVLPSENELDAKLQVTLLIQARVVGQGASGVCVVTDFIILESFERANVERVGGRGDKALWQRHCEKIGRQRTFGVL